VPWINNELRILMKKRDLALKTSLRSKLNTDFLIYKGLRNKVVSELRKAKVTYYTNLIDSSKGINNSLWKHLNNLTNKSNKHKKITELNINGKSITDSATIANEFNSYFVQSVEQLSKDFQPVDHFNLSLRDTTTDSSSYEEPRSYWLHPLHHPLKETAQHEVEIISSIMNCSLGYGIYNTIQKTFLKLLVCTPRLHLFTEIQ